MQASTQLLLSLKNTIDIPIEIMNEIDKILEKLEKKVKLTPQRKEVISEQVYSFYIQEQDHSSIRPIEVIGVVLYEILPFLTYQLICVWLGIKRTDFMKIRNKIVTRFPEIFSINYVKS